eukprot:384497-Prymnesium_polylepis.2
MPSCVKRHRCAPSRPGLAGSWRPCLIAACRARFSMPRSSRRSRPCVCEKRVRKKCSAIVPHISV